MLAPSSWARERGLVSVDVGGYDDGCGGGGGGGGDGSRLDVWQRHRCRVAAGNVGMRCDV